MFGINGGEFIVLLLVAAVVIGPERLPGYAEQLAGLVRSAKRMLVTAKERVDDEFKDELEAVDWTNLDPRRYDPRRIVRDALMEPDGLGLGALIGQQGADAGSGSKTGADAPGGSPAHSGRWHVDHPEREREGWTAPFDDEAT